MIKLIASNSTAFLAFECCTFLDLGGSCALFKIVSKHSFNLPRKPGSSVIEGVVIVVSFGIKKTTKKTCLVLHWTLIVGITHLAECNSVEDAEASQTAKGQGRSSKCSPADLCSLMLQSEEIIPTLSSSNKTKINICWADQEISIEHTTKMWWSVKGEP